jgi:ADP-L-glycero-D-manno-heptose 6-epimerase
MPEKLRGKYQYYTKAEMQKLRDMGYDKPFADLQQGVTDYVQNHLAKDYLTY